MLQLKVKYSCKDTPRISIPREGDIGFDLFTSSELFIPEGETRLINTGLSLELPKGYWLQLLDRSSISKNCHVMAGIIDETFRGTILIRMYCHTGNTSLYFPPVNDTRSKTQVKGFQALKGMSIAQGIIRKNYNREFELVESEELSDTDRGTGGFGSTNKARDILDV